MKIHNILTFDFGIRHKKRCCLEPDTFYNHFTPDSDSGLCVAFSGPGRRAGGD